MTLGVETDVDEGSMPTERMPMGARLSTFDAKNRRCNGPRNCTSAIIKEAIIVTDAPFWRSWTDLAGSVSDVSMRLTKRTKLFPTVRGEAPQVESPATVTITCMPFLIRRPRALLDGMVGCRFVRTAV